MAWTSTVDERYIGTIYSYAAGVYDAPYSTSTNYRLAPGIYAYGALINSSDADAYSLGILTPGSYRAVALSYNWDYTNLIFGGVPSNLNVHDSNGNIISTSYNGNLYFNVSQQSNYYISLSGSIYGSIEYAVAYTPNYSGNVTLGINGNRAVGSTINAVYNVSDLNGATNITPSYQWSRSVDGSTWSNISGATDSSYQLQPEDAGKYIRFAFAYTDNDGFIETSTSVATTKIVADTINPTVNASLPTNSSLVSISTNIDFLFSENIKRGAGYIFLKKSDGTLIESFNTSDSTKLTISNNFLEINPTADLSYSSQYKIEFTNGAIVDLSGNPYSQSDAYILNTVSQPSIASPSNTSFPLTSDALIDAMTNGFKWNLSGNRTIDWSISNGFNGEYWSHPDAVVDHIKVILEIYSYYANIKFNYLGYFPNPTEAANYGSDINIAMDGANKFFNNNSVWAIGLFPDAAYNSKLYAGASGDIYLNLLSDANYLSSYEPGSAGWSLIIHELGHTLGLKHPHDDGGTGRPTFDALGISTLNIDWATVMSYNDTAQFNLLSWDPATPMILDVLALQYLYGKNTTSNAGDSIFDLSETNFYSTYYDFSGSDTVNGVSATKAWTIILPNIKLSTLVDTKVGFAAPTSDLVGTPTTLDWIAGDIENVIGSNYDDFIQGNDLANTIFGGNGNDTIHGSNGNDINFGNAGSDIYEVSGNRGDYKLEYVKTDNLYGYNYAYKLTSKINSQNQSLLYDIEYIKYSDGLFSLNALLPPDNISPSILLLNPLDDSICFPINSNIVINFNENIQRGSGDIVLKKLDGSIIENYTLSSPNITISGSALIINPTYDLNYNTSYKLDLAFGSVKDLTGNDFQGVGYYNFSTDYIPTAAAASITTNEDTAKTGTLAGTDLDGNTLTFAKVADPSHGTVSINATTGAYTYTPALNYNGSDSFTFKVNDGTLDSAVATVSITIAPITDIAGHIYHWKSHSLMQGVQIADGAITSTTDGNGNFLFNASNPNSDLLIPTLAAQNTGSAIDITDALAALKIAVGRNPNEDGSPVSPYQYIAADVNEDGVVTSADALAIYKMALNRTDAPAAKWLFVNEAEDFWNEAVNSFTTSRKSVVYDKSLDVNTQQDVNVNLVAVLKGDVNGSWASAAGTTNLDTVSPNYFAELSSRLGSPQSQWGVII